jgi:hypothetical protein
MCRCSRRQYALCSLLSASVSVVLRIRITVLRAPPTVLRAKPALTASSASSLMSASAAPSPFTSATAPAAAPLAAAKITEIEGKVATLEGKIVTLEGRIAALDGEIEQAKAAKDADLTAKLEARRDKLEDMLLALQQEKNLLLQAQQQASKSVPSGQCKRINDTLIVKNNHDSQAAPSLTSLHSCRVVPASTFA